MNIWSKIKAFFSRNKVKNQWKAGKNQPQRWIGTDLEEQLDFQAERLANFSALSSQNSWLTKRVIDVAARSVIGTGIKPLENEELRKAFATKTLDATGDSNFYSMQRLILREYYRFGHSFLVRQSRSPLKMTVVSPQKLDRTKGNNGIEYTQMGRAVAYWFLQGPGKPSKRVPRKDVAHFLIKMFAGQKQGLPPLAQCLNKIEQLENYDESVLERHVLINALTGFVKSDPLSDAGELFGLDGDNSPDNQRLQEIRPGTLNYLSDGQDVSFPDIALPNYQQSGFADHLKRTVAAVSGYTYENLTQDYSNVNFSSARMGKIQETETVREIQDEFIIQVLEEVDAWFREDETKTLNYLDPSQVWVVPNRPVIDPMKDQQAKAHAIRNGFTDRDTIVMQLSGRKAEEVDAATASIIQREEGLGIVLDTNPKKVSAAGNPNPQTENEE